ncbi:uncharacterized protein LOC119693538 [Plutella xylostella]|uniref:uncharacterized protein LOC125490928 n=1 Tax=Plutella xylostella TaxID=51655 RepID=UPI0018D020E5|nr:uncharacterized protein LOC125490928 [Plutella xylostella]XP_048487931.1 uncharacterized protein LOC125491054 [Plutella xylostella]XP_048488267.1 uncharacterized protein LOC119693538 [Plutella xylostella]
MSGVQFGFLSTFDHQSQDWDTYRNRLSQWLIANEINVDSDKAGVKRRAILLSALTESTYKLASDLALPKKLEELTFEEIISLLDKHFTPKRCGFAERFNFYAATQALNEGHSQWAARLRGLAAHCGFNNLEESLLDRFVMGMAAGPERDKLFAQDVKELSLSKAVELAESVRCARAGAAAGLGRPGPAAAAASLALAGASVFSIESQKKTTSVDRCSVCGYKSHTAAQCRFVNFKCKKCGRKGHLRRMCQVQSVNVIEEASVSEGDDVLTV